MNSQFDQNAEIMAVLKSDFPVVVKVAPQFDESYVYRIGSRLFGATFDWSFDGIHSEDKSELYGNPDGFWDYLCDPDGIYVFFKEATPEVVAFKLQYG